MKQEITIQSMTPEKALALQAHLQAIAAILLEDTPAEKLTSLEEIEKTVRQQVLEHVSPQIGVFLSMQSQVQLQAGRDDSKVASASSNLRKNRHRS